MISLIKKDLLVLKNNAKTFFVMLVLYSIFSFAYNIDISGFFNFMALILFISTFSYDDFNKWNEYAVTLPNGRVNVVKGKYFTTILLIISATILSIILSSIVSITKNTFNIMEILSYTLGSMFISLFMMSILYPILFKYGAEKGRILFFAITCIIFIIIEVLSKMSESLITNNILAFLNQYGGLIFICFSILMITCSYFISKRIYSKKEF